mgnify:CR=1 FL=1
MAITTSAITSSFKRELLGGVQDIASGGDTLKLALYTDTSTIGPSLAAYTATGDGIISISSCGAAQTADTKLYVYDACGGAQVAYNDDAFNSECGTNFSSEVTFASTAIILSSQVFKTGLISNIEESQPT